METEFKTKADKLLENKGIKDKKKFLIISLCILISLSLWLLIKFSDDYQFTIQIPVSISNIPSDRILIGNDTIILTTTIKAEGVNAIYYYFFGKKDVIKIDYSLLKCKENTNKTSSQFNTQQLSKTIDKYLNFKHEMIALSPDNIYLSFEKTYFKIVPVKINTQLSFEDQFQLYDSIKITPNKICISGTEKALKLIDHLFSEPIVLNNLNADQNLYVSLVKPNDIKDIKLFIDKIKVNISVEKFTEATIEVPVTINKTNNKTKIKLFPENVKITYLVALKDYKKITKELFDVEVNGNVSKSDENNKLKVVLVKSPAFIKLTKIYPDNVEYIIFK